MIVCELFVVNVLRIHDLNEQKKKRKKKQCKLVLLEYQFE